MSISQAIRNAGIPAMCALTVMTCHKDPGLGEVACDPGGEYPQLANVVTSLAFNANVLQNLGVELEPSRATATAPQHPLSVLPGPATSYRSASECMTVEISDHHLTDLATGRVTHAGGPTLKFGAHALSLEGFELRPGAEALTLDIVSASGEDVLYGTLPHLLWDPSTGVLDMFNVDLSVTPTLAAKWNAPHLEGIILGTLTLQGTVALPSDGAANAAQTLSAGNSGAAFPPACDDFSGEVDVALISMNSVQQTFRLGDEVAITPSATLKNVGTANVPWHAKFTGNFPPYNIDQHPYLVWAVYREVDGVFEMLGHSDVKHAFLTLNSNCDPGACRQSTILGIGCEDVYGVGTNTTHLGPRSEVAPHAGTWAHCDFPAPNTPSHFDQVAPFCQQDNSGGGESGLEHRAVASDAELSVPGARYYLASWYVVRDDIDIFNTMGWRQLVPTRNGNTWTFDFATPFTQGSVVDAWVSPTTPAGNERNITHTDPSAGSVQLAVKTADRGDGTFAYTYAFHNHDYDARVGSLAMTLPPGVSVSQLRFRDGDEDPANDWVPSTSGGVLSWTAPSDDSKLLWGTMLSISFVADAAPVAGTVQLTRGDTGAGFSIDSLVMGGGSGGGEGFFDDFESGAKGWTHSGLWHLTKGADCAAPQPGYASATHAFYYGWDFGCNYAGNNTGDLISPEIHGITASSVLSFKYLREVENGRTGVDRADVIVLTATGGGKLASIDSRTPSSGVWTESGDISLAAYAGQTIRIVFRFTTVDSVANDFVGWLIDDVRVE